MPLPQFRPSEYVRYLEMSKNAHLLVEGTSDADFYKIVVTEVLKSSSAIDVDSAEQLVGFSSSGVAEPLGNNDKVEYIATLLATKSIPIVFQALSDRMLRGFCIDDQLITDNGAPAGVNSLHQFTDGHSVENYLFDCDIVAGACEVLCPNQCNVTVQAALRDNWRRLLEIAATITVLADEALINGWIPNLQTLHGGVTSGCISAVGVKLQFDQTRLISYLTDGHSLEATHVEKIAERLETIGKAAASSLDTTLRDISHGHLLLTVYWSSIVAFAVTCDPDPNKPLSKRLRSVPEYIRVNALLDRWKRAVPAGGARYPSATMEALRLQCT